MMPDFLRVPLGKIGTPVCRIGLSATYRPRLGPVHEEDMQFMRSFGAAVGGRK